MRLNWGAKQSIPLLSGDCVDTSVGAGQRIWAPLLETPELPSVLLLEHAVSRLSYGPLRHQTSMDPIHEALSGV